MTDVLHWDPEQALLWTGVITVAVQLICFFIAAAMKFDTITDISGSTNFTLIAVLTLALNSMWYTRQIIVTSMLVVSRTELGLFLLMRVCRRKKDARFDEVRENCVAFLVFWIFQMIWVYGVSMSVVILNSEVADPPLEARDYIGIVMFVIGFLVQAIGDKQKLDFRANPDNKGKWCDVGLWKWTRHPNYWGEIMLWWGIYVACTPAYDASALGWEHVGIISPILTMLILLGMTGMPTAEGDASKRYAHGDHAAAFIEYRKRTSIMWPLPPGVYEHVPMIVKRLLCFEFKCYEPPAEFKGEDNPSYGAADGAKDGDAGASA